MKAAVGGLASGEQGFEKYKKLLEKSFVFLNVYCTSVADEHKPRGPEGPYQFNDKSVPVLVIKQWDGTTLVQQLGFVAGKKPGLSSLARMIDKAVKQNGPVMAPKKLRPLIKSYEKAEKALAKGQTSTALRELEGIVGKGSDKKQFPQTPTVVKKAQEWLAKLEAECRTAMEEIAAGDQDPADARTAYRKLLRTYSGSRKLKELLRKAIRDLPGS